eukprot:TRINITY_DN5181_c0_g1_i1.p1 TRINITY_DN5181_c0_g1~~TRINITY_DN5181_c0_g1_i1.p1  ORF type:complete len:421 (-),score=59.33 TRINITY_DN5181_c0_g1_i1:35-1297(-)
MKTKTMTTETMTDLPRSGQTLTMRLKNPTRRTSPRMGRRRSPTSSLTSNEVLPPRSDLQNLLINLYVKQIPILQKIQSYRHPILEVYMRIATMCGDEVFYITFLPFVCWFISVRLVLNLTSLMALCICSGNYLKNTFCIPRPPHPEVRCVGHQDDDHGFPSTHTISATAFPSFFVWYMYNVHMEDAATHPISAGVAFILLCIWSLSIISSRVYNGQHSLTDVGAGMVIGLTILYSWINHISPVLEYWASSGGPLVGIALFLGGAAILAAHPVPDRPTSALGESGLVVGSAVGSSSSIWANHYFGILTGSSISTTASFFTSSHPAILVFRFVLGCALVILSRFIFKKVAVFLVSRYFPSTWERDIKYVTPSIHDTRPFDSRRGIDMPVKYLTYYGISAMICLGVPCILTMMGFTTMVEMTF